MALTESAPIEVGSAANVLLLAPTMHAETSTGCGTLLGAGEPPGDALLSVLTVESPDDILRIWQTHVAEQPPEMAAFVLLGGQQSTREASTDDTRIVHPVKSPSNLTDLGVATSTYLADWNAEDRSIACCFQSITTLLQYVEGRVVYRFLHQFTQQITAVDGVAHYHLDPAAVEPPIVNTLLTLFDAVVELDDDDAWSIRTRSLG